MINVVVLLFFTMLTRFAVSLMSNGQQQSAQRNTKLSHAQFIETVNADDLINTEQENVNYVIKNAASLHQCIKKAGDIPNKQAVQF